VEKLYYQNYISAVHFVYTFCHKMNMYCRDCHFISWDVSSSKLFNGIW